MSAEEALGAATGDEGVDHRTPQQVAASKKLQVTQAKVDEVVEIMTENMNTVLKRDAELSQLEMKSDQLKETSSLFQAGASKLKHKFQWANMKIMIIIGVILLIAFVIIIAKIMPDRHEPQSHTDHSSPTRAADTATVTHQTQKTSHTPTTTPSATTAATINLLKTDIKVI